MPAGHSGFNYTEEEIAQYRYEQMDVLRYGDATAMVTMTEMMRCEALNEQQRADVWRIVRRRYMGTELGPNGERSCSEEDLMRLVKRVKEWTELHE